MAHMVPVVFVYVDGGDGEALYVDGLCVLQDTHLSALSVLSALDGVLYSYGTGSLTYEYFCEEAKHEFPPNLADIPASAWEDPSDFPQPCEDCGCFHEAGSC